MKRVKLTRNKFTLIDDNDYEKVIQYKWLCNNYGYATRQYWDRISKKYKGIFLSNFILGALENQSVDHINGNRLDNRKNNLRICSFLENRRNKSIYKNNKSGFKGVDKSSKNRWRATIRINGEKIHLGSFIDKKEAALAYDLAAQKHFGEFARLNFAL